MNDEQLAALREAYDWLQFAIFERRDKSQADFDAMMERLESAFPELAKEAT